MSLLPNSDSIQIREVWAHNLEEEFYLIRQIVDDYPYVAMDTEFPGIIIRPLCNVNNYADFQYQTMKANADILNLIQLGLTFSDEKGNLPTCGTDKYCIWQFNFREFNPNEVVFTDDSFGPLRQSYSDELSNSVELLRQKGIDFARNNETGIDAKRFEELLMSSGVVLNDTLNWVTFHGGHGFGYLLKLLTRKNLPDTLTGFFNLISVYFPVLYDVKHLVKFTGGLRGIPKEMGLNELAEKLEVEADGTLPHQAGSGSLLILRTFMQLKMTCLHDSALERYSGVLYGFGGVKNGRN